MSEMPFECIMDISKLIKKIYSELGDDESKDIFRCRLDYSLLGDTSFLAPISDAFKRKVESDIRYIEAKETVGKIGDGSYIFGTGAYGRMLAQINSAVKWKGFIASSPKTKEYQSYPVIDIAEFEKVYKDENVF